MLVQKYKDMLSGKSVIRQLSEFATARGQEIGYENVFDYSLESFRSGSQRIYRSYDPYAGNEGTVGTAWLQSQPRYYKCQGGNCGEPGEKVWAALS